MIFCIYVLGYALPPYAASAGKFMKVPKEIISSSLFFPSKSESLIYLASRPILSMQKAQGLDLHNKDRLESSRRQRDKDLQLQLKWTKGGEMETADFPPVQSYSIMGCSPEKGGKRKRWGERGMIYSDARLVLNVGSRANVK